MDAFILKLTHHAQHIKRVGHLCTTEETTKQALILPMLDILGFNPYAPTRGRAEHSGLRLVLSKSFGNAG